MSEMPSPCYNRTQFCLQKIQVKLLALKVLILLSLGLSACHQPSLDLLKGQSFSNTLILSQGRLFWSGSDNFIFVFHFV